MKKIFKVIQISLLIVVLIVQWIALMLLGFMSTIAPNTAWLYNVTPFIGIIVIYCIIREIIRIYKL